MVYVVQKQEKLQKKKKKKRTKSYKQASQITAKLINDLLVETNKYTHYNKVQIEKYNFTKRLQECFKEYSEFITRTKQLILIANSSYDNLRKFNKEKK